MGIAVRCFAVVAFFCPSTEDAKTSGPIATGAFCCLALNILDSGSQTGILSNASIGPDPARCCSSWSIRLTIFSLGLVTVHPSRPLARVPKVTAVRDVE